MTLLVSSECAENPRMEAWSAQEQEQLQAALELMETQPAHPALGIASVNAGHGKVHAAIAPGGRRLFFRDDQASDLSLFAIRQAPPETRLSLPTVEQLHAFGRSDCVVLEHGKPARPPVQRSGIKSSLAIRAADLTGLAMLSNRQLAALGVPEDLFDAVRKVPDVEFLKDLGLHDQVLHRLHHQLVVSAPSDVEFVPDILKYRVPDIETLRRYYAGDLRRLLLNLEAEQKKIVDLDARGPVLVNGVAGSGKTTVALYRAQRLLEQGELLEPPRILYLAYNKSLIQAARELLRDLCGERAADIEIRTVHAWATHYLESHGRRIHVADSRKRHAIIMHAVRTVRDGTNGSAVIFQRDAQFWLDEIAQVIKGRCRGVKSEYLAVDRYGRGSALQSRTRKLVWRVYQEYSQMLEAEGTCDWEDVLLSALDVRASDRGFEPYDYVFVDEAQDLPPIGLELIARLVPARAKQIFVVADAAQSIYQQGFRWKDVGLHVRGRSHSLSRNFRSTVEIVEAARGLVQNSAIRDDPDVLDAQDTHRHGPKPHLIRCQSFAGELDFVVRDIDKLVRLGLAVPGNIAVLARSVDAIQAVGQALDRKGILYRRYDEGELVLSDPSVKVVTLHSGKGLEFPIVYLVDVNRGRLPKPAPGLAAEDADSHELRERKLLYVGMTRAIQELSVTYTAGRESVFLSDFDPSAFELLDPTSPSSPEDGEVRDVAEGELMIKRGDLVQTRRSDWMEVTKIDGDLVLCLRGGREVGRHVNSIVYVRRGEREWRLANR